MQCLFNRTKLAETFVEGCDQLVVGRDLEASAT